MTHQTAPVVSYTPSPVSFQDIPMPTLPSGAAIIQCVGAGLCGTDAEKIEQQKVSVGTVLGHEVVGKIHQLSSDYQGDLSVGQRVVLAHHVPCGTCHFCVNESPSMCEHFKKSNLFPGGFAPYFNASAEHLQHTTFAVPAHISDREAVCLEPLACVLRAIRRTPLARQAEKQAGSVAVIGLGFIGLLTAQALKLERQAVLGFDLNPARLALSNTLAFADLAVHPTEHKSEYQAWLSQQAVQKVDAVFLTVVNPQTLALALRLVRNGGTLTLMAGNSHGEILDPATLYYREINVVTSYSPALQDLQHASTLLFERKIVVNPLMTHPMPIEAFNEGLQLYRSGEAIKVFYSY